MTCKQTGADTHKACNCVLDYIEELEARDNRYGMALKNILKHHEAIMDETGLSMSATYKIATEALEEPE